MILIYQNNRITKIIILLKFWVFQFIIIPDFQALFLLRILSPNRTVICPQTKDHQITIITFVPTNKVLTYAVHPTNPGTTILTMATLNYSAGNWDPNKHSVQQTTASIVTTFRVGILTTSPNQHDHVIVLKLIRTSSGLRLPHWTQEVCVEIQLQRYGAERALLITPAREVAV